MIETMIALLAAHAVADFVLQFDWIVTRKRERRVFALHVGIVFAVSAAALGPWVGNWAAAAGAALAVTAAHAGLDALKTWGRFPAQRVNPGNARFEAFCLDQIGHLISIVAIAALFPNAFADGLWGQADDGGRLAAVLMALVAGFVLATRTGQFLITEFMTRFMLKESKSGDEDPGLPNGGAWIGLLERALIFALVLAGRFDAIGFLLAAKSVLRFQYAKDRSQSEYVIIGTLASFGWALAIAAATAGVLTLLDAPS